MAKRVSFRGLDWPDERIDGGFNAFAFAQMVKGVTLFERSNESDATTYLAILA